MKGLAVALLVVHLTTQSFPPVLPPSAIHVIEAKHDRDITQLMQWQVDRTRKRLKLSFRPGNGDFGAGNRIEVRISRKALLPPASGTLIRLFRTD